MGVTRANEPLFMKSRYSVTNHPSTKTGVEMTL